VIPSNDDDKIQEKEQQVNHTELNQETLSLHIPEVVQERFHHTPLQQVDQPLVQPEDDPSQNLPMSLVKAKFDTLGFRSIID
jgi:hypothetical protein